MFVNRSRLLAAVKCDCTRRYKNPPPLYPPPPRIGPVLPGSSAADELIELINGYIKKISFFVNINLNKSYCKDCIIYMAHIVLDLSLPSVFSSFFSLYSNSYFAHITCHTWSMHHDAIHVRSHPQSYPIHFIVRRFDHRAIVDPNSLCVSRSRRGALYNVALPYDNIATHVQDVHVSHPTCTKYIYISNTSSDIYNILLSAKLPQNASTFIFISLLQTEAFNSSRSLRKYL